MATHTFSKGDRVAIINSTLNGLPLLEGHGRVKKLLDVDEYYRVSFEGCFESADRFVDPDAQADPAAYIAEMSARISAAAA